MARLKDQFEKEFLGQLQEELKLSNPMEVPRVSKISVNMGVGEAKTDAKLLDDAVAEMTIITGQKPKLTRARKSIANFKLREGMAVGCTVTLRGARMYEFLDRLIAIALPRIRDFRGIKRKSFDGRGNMSLGVKEQIIFPEIDYDSITQTRGMDITITTTARNDDEGRALLTKLGMPFRER
ncbi:MAG: 50S ribosomal protein L5 [Thermoleophilia bacterium]